MLIVTDSKINVPYLKSFDSLKIEELYENIDTSKYQFILLNYNNETIHEHSEVLKNIQGKLILLIDFSDLSNASVLNELDFFMVLDKKYGIEKLSKFMFEFTNKLTVSIQKTLEDYKTQIRELEDQLKMTTRMVTELSNANTELLSNDWAKD